MSDNIKREPHNGGDFIQKKAFQSDISFKHLIRYLEPRQKKINRFGGITSFPLSPMFEDILGDINKFHYLKLGRKNTFLHALLGLMVDGYIFKSQRDQYSANKVFRNKLIIDLTEKDLYHALGYHLRRDMNRSFIQRSLLDESFNLDSDELKSVRRYMIEYLDINVAVINCTDMKTFIGVDWILSCADGLNNEYKPTILMIKNNGRYNGVLPMTETIDGIGYHDRDDWVRKLYQQYPIFNFSMELNNRSMIELRKIADERGLKTRKASDKAHNGKMVLKSKTELLTDLLA